MRVLTRVFFFLLQISVTITFIAAPFSKNDQVTQGLHTNQSIVEVTDCEKAASWQEDFYEKRAVRVNQRTFAVIEHLDNLRDNALKENAHLPMQYKLGLWYIFEDFNQCISTVKIGAPRILGNGAKYICNPHKIQKPCLIYSFGVNEDISFELDFLDYVVATCEIHTFDPAPSVYENTVLLERMKEAGIYFHPHGIGLGLTLHEIIKKTHSEADAITPVIDILKIDIDGGEYEFLQWFKSQCHNLTINQILIEFHVPSTMTPMSLYLTTQILHTCGYKLFKKDPNRVCDSNRHVCFDTSWVHESFVQAVDKGLSKHAFVFNKHVITLERFKDRHQLFISHNKGINNVVFRFGIDIRKWRQNVTLQNIVNNKVKHPALYWKTAVILNSISHLSILEECVLHQTPYTILEDDAILVTNFDEKASKLMHDIVENWDIILWGYNWDAPLHVKLFDDSDVILQVNLQSEINQFTIDSFKKSGRNSKLHRLVMGWGIHCYTVSPSGAAKIIKAIPKITDWKIIIEKIGIRWWAESLDGIFNHLYQGLNAFAALPPLSYAENNHSTSKLKAEF